jgi:hypothetical protein
MGYIIIWRHRHREPHVQIDDHEFIEDFSSYESAKEEAERILDHEGPKSQWYFDYAIYEEADD